MSPNITNSTTVDERVVEMHIDNSKFEDGAKKTIGILEKLDKALHLHAETDEIDKLNRSLGNFDVSPMANGLDSLKSHFSALEIVGMRVISNLTDSVYNFTARTIKDLTIEPVTAGWSKLEEKTQSVQTIMNSTGLSLEEVNKYLEDLMWYSDETSFGFTDMTTALATMTSTGGDIKKLIPMIMGIGNAVAYAGKGAAEFKRSIMNLNQSYSGGYLTLMDWRSLQLAGTNSKALMETIIKTAEEMGKVEKGAITAANFTEKLKDKWADQEVMEKAFGYFAEMSVRAKELIDEGVFDNAYEAYDYLADHFDEIQSKAAKAAQECKSFKDVLDALKDAASTGWMSTFEHIFGNFEQQKELWGEVYDRLEQIFVTGGRTRNSILELALGTGQEIKQTLDEIESSDALDKLARQTEALREPIAGGIKSWEDFMHYFTATGATGHELGWALSEIEAATKQGVHFDHQLGNITWTLEDLEQAFKSGKIPIEDYIAAIEILSDKELLASKRQLAHAAEAGTIDQLGKSFWEKQTDGIVKYLVELGRADEVEKKMQQARALGWDESWILENWEKPLQKYREAYDKILNKPVTMPAVSQATKEMQAAAETRKEGYQMLVEGLLNLLDHLVVVINTVRNAYEEVFGTVEVRAQRLKGAIEIFHSFTEQIGFSEEALVGVQKAIEIIFAGVKLLGKVAGGVFTLLWRIIWPVANIIDDIFAMIGQSSFSVDNLMKSLEKRFSDLWPAIDSIANAFGFLFSVLFDLVGLVGGGLYVAFTNLLNIAGPIGNVIQFIADKISSFTKSLQRFGKYLKEGFKRNGFLGALETFFTGLRIEVKTTFPQLYGWFTRISDFFKNSQANISEFFSNFKLFESLPSVFQSGLVGLGGLFSVVLGGILTLITGILQGLQGVNFDTEKISESFNNFYEIVKLVFNGLFGDPTEFKERITNFVLEAWSGFKAALEQISIRDAIKALRLSFLFAIGAKIMSVLSMVKKIGDEAATIPESLSWSIKRGGKMLEDIGKSFQANALIKMAAAVIMVSMALYGLSRINEDKLTHAAAVISVVMIILTMLVNSTRKATVLKNVDIKKFQVFGTVGSALIGLGVAIAAFTYAVFKIANAENPKRLAIAAIAVLAFIGIITAVIGFFAVKLVKSNANWERLKNIGMIMSRLGGAFLSISISIGMLVLPILAFTAAAAILEKNKLSASHVWFAAIAIMGLIMSLGLALSMLMKSMETLDEKQLKNVGTALLKIGGSIFLMAIGFNMFMFPFLTLAAACVAVYAFTQDLSPIWQALGMFGAIFAGLSIFMGVIVAILGRKHMNPVRIKAIGMTMLKIGGSIALVAVGMNKLVNALLKIVVVTALLEHFGLGTSFNSALETLAKLAVGLVAIMFIMSVISSMPGVKPKTLFALAAALTALGVAFLFMTPAILGMSLVIGVLVYLTSTLTDFDQVMKRMSHMSWQLIKIAFAATIFGAGMLAAGVGALAASVSIGILAVSFLAIVKALDLLATNQDKIFELFRALKRYFTIDNILMVAKMTVVFSGFILLLLALTKRLKDFAVAWKLLSVGGGISEKLSSSLGKFGQNIPNLLHGVFTRLTTYLTTHAEDIIPALAVVITIVGGYLTGLIPTLSTQLVAAITALLSSLAAELKSNKDILISSLSSIANTIFDVFSEVLQKVFIDGYKDRNFFGKLMTWILGGMGGIAGMKFIASFLNLIFAGSRVATLFKGKNGNGLSSIGGKAGAVINVGSAVINVANGTGGPGGSGGKVTPFPNPYSNPKQPDPLTAAEVVKSAGGMIAPFALSIGGTVLAIKGLEKVITNKIYKDAFNGLGNTVDDAVVAIGRIDEDIQALKAEQIKLSNLTDEEKSILAEQYKALYNPNATEEEIVKYIAQEEADKAKSNFDKIDQYDIKIRQHEEVLDAIYDSIADSLNVSKEKLVKYLNMYDDTEEALEAVQMTSVDKVLSAFKRTGMKDDAFSTLLNLGKLFSKDEGLKNILNANLATNNLGANADEAIGHILSGQASISSLQVALYSTLQQAYNDPALKSQVVDILKKSGLSEDISTAMKELGLDAIKNSQYTQAFVDSLKQIAEDENVRSQINAKYGEIGKFIDHAIAGTITQDDFSRALLIEFVKLKDDAQLMQAIQESCPQFGEFITHMVSSKIESNEIATKLIETLREAMAKPEIKSLIEESYPELGQLINDSVSGSITKDDLSPEILNELTALTRDSSVLTAIQASYPELGKQITNALLDGITVDDLAKGIIEKVNTTMNDPTVQSGLGHGQNILGTALTDAGYSEYANLIQNGAWGQLAGKAVDAVIADDSDYQQIYDSWKNIAGAIPEGGEDGVNAYMNLFTGAVEQMGLNGIDIFQTVNDSHSPSRVYEKLASYIPAGLALGIDEYSQTAIRAIENLARRMQVPFQNIQSRFHNFGIQAVRGVVIGINNNVNAAYNAGVNLANAVNRGYTDTLKIHSPSQVFEDLSRFIPEGAANGIMQGLPIAVAAASDLGNAIADEAANAMSNVAYIASDEYDLVPQITPVIDLNGAYDGMDRLESILADNPLTMSIRTNPSQRSMPQNATTYNFTNQNKNVVDAVNRLNDRITQLGEEITNMKIVLNSGVLVGEMAPAMNERLGTLALRERRQ